MAHNQSRRGAHALTALALLSVHRAELVAALPRGDWSVIYGFPPNIQTLVLAQIGPIFIAGMQSTLLVTAAGNFACVVAALVFMPRMAAADGALELDSSTPPKSSA